MGTDVQLEEWETVEAEKIGMAIEKRLRLARYTLMAAGIAVLDYDGILLKAIIEDEVREGNL